MCGERYNEEFKKLVDKTAADHAHADGCCSIECHRKQNSDIDLLVVDAKLISCIKKKLKDAKDDIKWAKEEKLETQCNVACGKVQAIEDILKYIGEL